MRVLIVSAAILACASCAPSFLSIAPLAAVAPVAPVLTVNTGDLAAAATDARVEAQDHARAAIEAHNELSEQVVSAHSDAARELADQAREIHEERFWNAEDHKWQTYDAIKTHESEVDGASAAVSPVLAKSLVAAPAVALAPVAVAQPLAAANYVAQHSAYGAIAHNVVLQPETKSVVTQSLSQTHPAPAAVLAAAPVLRSAIVEAAPIAHSGLIAAGPSLDVISPAKQTVVTQSLSQTHPAPLGGYATSYVAANAAPVVASENILASPLLAAAQVAQPGTRSVVTSSLSQTHGGYAAGYAQPAVYAAPAAAAPLYGTGIVGGFW